MAHPKQKTPFFAIGDRKIAITKFCDRDHLAIFFSSEDRRSPRDRDQKIADRSCLAYFRFSIHDSIISKNQNIFDSEYRFSNTVRARIDRERFFFFFSFFFFSPFCLCSIPEGGLFKYAVYLVNLPGGLIFPNVNG